MKFFSKKKNILIPIAGLLICASLFVLLANFFNWGTKQKVDEMSDFYTGDKGRLLFLASYDVTFPSFRHEFDGVESTARDYNLDLDVLFLHAKEMKADDNQKVEDFIAANMKDQGSFDGVIAGDDEALQFVLDHEEDLFKGLPVGFFAVNDEELAQKAAEKPLFTGAVEQTYIDETVTTAAKIQPSVRRVTAIVDNTATGQGDYKAFQKYGKEHPEYETEILNTSEMTREDLAAKLEAVGDHTVLLYMSASDDIDGNYYSVAEDCRFIGKHTDIPVYKPCGGGFNTGITGGMVMDFEKSAAEETGKIADHIVNGTDISKMELTKDVPGVFMFDMNEMKKFGIKVKDIPEDAVIYNYSYPLLQRMDWKMTLPTLGILAGLLLLIFVFYSNTRDERKLSLQLKASNEQLLYASRHDVMTGLINRNSSLELLAERLSEWNYAAVVAADFDDLKNINEHYGHEAGDELLREVGSRLKKLHEEQDVFAARFGGDEFILAFPNRTIAPDDPLMQDLHRIFHVTVTWHGMNVAVMASAGIVNDVKKDNIREKVSDAENALYEAKKKGKDLAVFFTPDMRTRSEQKSHIREVLSSAIRNDGFRLVYQPQVRISDYKIVGYEALLRLKAENISPGLFIPVSEECGWIRRIGRIATEMTIRQMAEWRDEGREPVTVSVNYSSEQIEDSGYPDFLRKTLEKYKVDARYLVIEITESVLMSNSAEAFRFFEVIRDIGCPLSLDDFGSGYTNFSYLNFIPAVEVKLDKSLIDAYLNQEDKSTIPNIIDMAHKLGKKVIAEGVEKREQAELLEQYGCDEIQGYLFSRPTEPDQAIKMNFINMKAEA